MDDKQLPGVDFYCGHTDEWRYFREEYEHVLDSLTKAYNTTRDLLAGTKAKLTGSHSSVMYFLGVSCLKDFSEILLLSGNGYGSGATKLLRGFYERVVTYSYLSKYPDKIQQFIDYSDIHWHKLLEETKKIHTKADLPPEQIKVIEESFERSKARYTEDVCKPCKKTRLQMSWTKLSLAEQATKVSDKLRLLFFQASLMPTFYLHTTYWGITMQAEVTSEEKLRPFGTAVERKAVRETLPLSHILLIQTAETTDIYFDLSRQQTVIELAKECKEAWEKVRLSEAELSPPPQSP